MSNYRKRLINSTVGVFGYIFVVLLGLSISGCTKKSEEPVSIGIGSFSNAVDYAPLYVAEHFGWLESSGVSTTIADYGDRAAFAAAIDAGQIDFIFAAAPPILISRAAGVDVSIVEVSCTLRQEILVQADSDINNISDLAEKRIAVLAGTSSHYGLLKTLESVGVSSSDVLLVDQGPGAAEAGFESGVIDAWAVWPPFVEKQQVSGKGRVVLGGDAVIQSVVGVSGKALRENPETVEFVISAIRRSKEWIVSNPDEAQALVSKKLGLDPEIIGLAWEKHDWAATMSSVVHDDVEEKIGFLSDRNLLRDNYESRIVGWWSPLPAEN